MTQSQRSAGRRFSDLRGAVRLTAEATAQVTDIAEGVHRAVGQTIGLPGGAEPGRTRGLTGWIYGNVRAIARAAGVGIEAGLSGLERLSLEDPGAPDAGDSRRRRAALAALNGVMGDRLARDGNPLTQALGFFGPDGEDLDDLAARRPELFTSKALLMVHGLCLDDFSWRPTPSGADGGAGGDRIDLSRSVADAVESTPVYARYNTGLHISENGRRLAGALEGLVKAWPTSMERLDVVAHSMGGLVVRCAYQQAVDRGLSWPGAVDSIIFLGTPHHGAPLEKLGGVIDTALGGSRWTEPFLKLAHLRSAGITDLRHGALLDVGDASPSRFGDQRDRRRPLPLPEGVKCRTAVATLTARRGSGLTQAVHDGLLGDGLVPVPSALGRHPDPGRALDFDEDSSRLFYGLGHFDLLYRREVAEQVVDWLRTEESPPFSLACSTR
ncbi:MAG: alpha/beta hydrolase [Acidobacteriota bacterium]